MEPTSTGPEPVGTPMPEALVGTGEHTRRTFIRGVAAAGLSTATVVSLEKLGAIDLWTDALAQAGPGEFSSFTAIAASAEDVVQVPPGFRADVLIRYGDRFAGASGDLRYGYNNDFLAFFPLPAGSGNPDEGLIFVNHEYPLPFFLHGNADATTKTREQVAIEQHAVGNSVVHIRRDRDGIWQVVSPSPYNRRITGAAPTFAMTGPLAGNPAYPGVGTSANGSLANCSGGTTPWGTALSCEENYQDYATLTTVGSGYGWTSARTGTDDYYNGDGTATTAVNPGPLNEPDPAVPGSQRGPAKYGWVCEHDPYDVGFQPRKHTALGRFRHENAAFRVQGDRPFVLYMGDDRTGGGVYKFVSDHRFVPGDRAHNSRILAEGTLYVARWEPEGRRRFSDRLGTQLVSVPNGTGRWRKVEVDELVDTQARIRAAVGASEWDAHFATNRPEDLEVGEDGSVYIALTNNSQVNDVHGAVRRLREYRNDPASVGADRPFIWEDYAAGGPTGSTEPGREGFSSPDNLVFDKSGNLWVVTDISTSALPPTPSEYARFHGNNAVFMIPRGGPNAGVAFRFANMPVQAEGTGPYFTPDEQTLFINVQHPGEGSTFDASSDPARPETYKPTSYWPRGNKTREQNPSTPIPATVAITRVSEGAPGGSPIIPPPPAQGRPDATRPRISLLSAGRQKLGDLRGGRFRFRMRFDEAVTVRVTLSGRLASRFPRRGGDAAAGRGRLRRLAQASATTSGPGEVVVRLRPGAALRVLLRRERRLPALLRVEAVDRSGNRTTRTKPMTFG